MNNLQKNILLAPFNILYKISPELELKLLFRIKQGYKLNLSAPRTYNEKLQWIKLYDHHPLMPKCCDKYTVRQYVEDQGCAEILNRLLWHGFEPENIPFDELPEKYVIKATHGSTFNIIQDGTKQISRREVIDKCRKWLKAKYLPCYGEWFYGIEKPRIIVEDFIESQDDEQLRDYKVFCFNGRARMIRVDTERFTNLKMDFFDTNWKRIQGARVGYPVSGRNFPKPAVLNELLSYAEVLSKPFSHARVDFYIAGERIYFGEITFTNGAGFGRFSTYDFDLMIGDWLRLDKRQQGIADL